MPTILVIEDEPNVADNLVYALQTEGFDTHWCATGGDGLEKLAATAVDLVVLDVGLPDIDGFEVCRNIRKTAETPVLFLTARDSEIDRIVGLEIGGDDYVTKPFSPREVTARVKAILRRTRRPAGGAATKATAAANDSAIQTDFHVDRERHEIRWGASRLDLTPNEFNLLACLIGQPGRVFTREVLMTQAWEDPGSATERTVDAHVRRLRAKLRALRPDDEVIQTVRGIGYTFRPSNDASNSNEAEPGPRT